jgi:hypothetical protein
MTEPDGSRHTEDVQDMDLGVLPSGVRLFVRRKGDNGEWHGYNSDYFYFFHDTSPDVNKDENVPRVYTLYERQGGPAGAKKSKVHQAVGEQWVAPANHWVQFRAKGNCRPLAGNTGEARNTSVIVRYEQNYTFNRYGQGLTFDEVVWESGVGSGPQEVQIYGRKGGKSCGWIGWSSSWAWSEPVEIFWNRGRLTTEPKRYCGW